MNAAEARARIEAERLLAILRLDSGDDVPAVAAALARGGIRLIEVALTTPNGLRGLGEARAAVEGDVALGAGTVVTADDARRALAAGADFLVAPGFDEGVLALARAADVLYVPGAFSPGEFARVLAAGVELVKLFPAGRLGPAYVRDLLGPFPALRLVATGAVDATNARGFLDAGAVAVAFGGALVRGGRQPHELTAAAAELVATVA